jgi:hypothetical protein
MNRPSAAKLLASMSQTSAVRTVDARVVRAKQRLDRLRLYPAPVRIDRVHLFVTPWLFRLPWFRRFDGYALHGTILLRRAGASEDLVTHELCHVWQMQHRPVAMPLSYLLSGYTANPFERQARAAVAATRDAG